VAPILVVSGAPVVLPETLAFCGHSGSSCCSAMDDAMLMEEFKGLNVSHDAGCTDIVKAILCEVLLRQFSYS
jgi:hypothetical protein